MSEMPEYLRGTAMGRMLYGDGPSAPFGLAAAYPEVAEQVRRDIDTEGPSVGDILVASIDTPDSLKAALATLELTQAGLAEALGVSGTFISQMVGGKPIDRRTDFAIRALLAIKSHGGI